MVFFWFWALCLLPQGVTKCPVLAVSRYSVHTFKTFIIKRIHLQNDAVIVMMHCVITLFMTGTHFNLIWYKIHCLLIDCLLIDYFEPFIFWFEYTKLGENKLYFLGRIMFLYQTNITPRWESCTPKGYQCGQRSAACSIGGHSDGTLTLSHLLVLYAGCHQFRIHGSAHLNPASKAKCGIAHEGPGRFWSQDSRVRIMQMHPNGQGTQITEPIMTGLHTVTCILPWIKNILHFLCNFWWWIRIWDMARTCMVIL